MDKRQSKHWERPSPAQRHLDSRFNRISIELKRRGQFVPRYSRHSKHWERSSPTQRPLDSRFNRLSLELKRPSSSKGQFVPEYNRHSKHWERSSPAQWHLDSRFNGLSIELKRPSSSRRQFVPRYNRHSRHWERSSPTQRHLDSRFNRLSIESKRPSTSRGQFVPWYKRHSDHWKRSSPAQRNLHFRFNRLSIELKRPSSSRGQFVPRYNRHSDDSERPSPAPNNALYMLGSPRHEVQSTKNIVYPEGAVFRWLATGLEDDDQFPSSVCLKRISLEPSQKTGQNPSLVLVNSRVAKDTDEEGGSVCRRPWEYVAEKVWPDLLSCLENIRKKMKCQDLEEVHPNLVARFGKNIFHGSAVRWFDKFRKAQSSETTLGKFTKFFHANVPTSYTEKLVREAVPKLGLDFIEKKDIYQVRLYDSTQEDSIISCKCTLNNDKKLELYKIKLINRIRHMVVNISCLDKDVDLRLMLSGKRMLTALTDNVMERISNLINSAVVDPEKKGGFRWPQTAFSQSSRYRVVAIWHTISEVYETTSLMLEVRSAHRYMFDTATEEATREVSLKFKGIISELLAQKQESYSIYYMFKDSLEMIWEHFLCCEHFLTTDSIEEVGGQKY
ncbi:uncharacterized protein LOC123208378 [Mangifera indica]|uniref:uncharacterized protein LOC123208378 n=1 Tax=Mangifera indica TaxID=29780 RepID=UPI001CFC183E|nr:uncharacterized protein LOC123208378 [Mangifera indica]